jgi:hypothetical protein
MVRSFCRKARVIFAFVIEMLFLYTSMTFGFAVLSTAEMFQISLFPKVDVMYSDGFGILKCFLKLTCV